MVYVATNWTEQLAQMGNLPGAHLGNVTVLLVPPLLFEGSSEITVPSANVILAAEGGDTVLYHIQLPDGRRLSLEPTSVVGQVDAKKTEGPDAQA